MRAINIQTILHIEDESGYRELTKRLEPICDKCYKSQVSLLTEGTWERGLEVIRSRPIDVLILDLILKDDVPVLRREDTLELIRSTPDLPPIVVMTGIADDDFIRDKCILAGADSYMHKLDFNHHPEQLFEKCYEAFMRRQRDLRNAPRT